ncbi:MAG: 50S ribosomal protein L32e [Candidatus Lokiarchaeota archaeon]|nr:50S ribosomal protein L32e [Candidatus Lokiarchaeota archaeon]
MKAKILAGHSRKRFIRGESWRYVRLQTSWRKPNGKDNKMRWVFARGTKPGLPRMPAVGYRSPSDVRGLHPSGYECVVVHSEGELEALRPKSHAIMIGATVGRRKRITLKDAILSRGFKLLNPGIKVAAVAEEATIIAPEDVDATVGKVEGPSVTADDLKDVDVDDDKDDGKGVARKK